MENGMWPSRRLNANKSLNPIISDSNLRHIREFNEQVEWGKTKTSEQMYVNE